MLSSLLRPKKSRPRAASSFKNASSHTSPAYPQRGDLNERRRMAATVDDDSFDEEEEPEPDGQEEDGLEEEEDQEDENKHGEASPLLPMFEASHLDALPVYNLTHTIRILVVPRCETTLSWDQLRSPQVSQFLVKPIQQQILSAHFSSATLYALMANCLQFSKEAQTNPGNSGTSKTRGLVCELLAMKLLKEYSTRELIDALSYDFYPLQGLVAANDGTTPPTPKAKVLARVARISTIEVAIRAQAKRFLAHPLVVQQLEAIWAGTIVFHSAADNMHRTPKGSNYGQNRGYDALQSTTRIPRTSPNQSQQPRPGSQDDANYMTIRRSVTLYDSREASLFKLSRLRVPRYRQVLSTLSLAVLLGLFLAVLVQRSLTITVLEVIFWLWSAGFMLDEVVGFNEQGFSLYIMSFWNTFDLGILLLLGCYYCMRLYGILMPDLRKHHVADMAYDVLAANAVLLFPRIFSVLDHYRYFSQLLIAFRMMAMDLVALFVLIIISCSGFFVAFTLSFGNDGFDPKGVAYALFQMLMGFTPAAWDRWQGYNRLGQGILTLFLFICHFLIVTILITVLTNSFMAIVQNANEEHQFVFAVNAISMVKSDALFSYIAPTNILAWLLTPLRFVLPFNEFVKLNRTVIKVTHFPVLLAIYLYERTVLRKSAFEPTELVEQRGRSAATVKAFENPGNALNLFSPRHPRLREPSVATFHKDKALAEVFRRPFKGNTQKSYERRTTSTVVNNWMKSIGPEGTTSSPNEQDREVLEGVETRRAIRRSSQLLRHRSSQLEFTAMTMSVASDPEDFVSRKRTRAPAFRRDDSDLINPSIDEIPDGDGDDELATNDDDTVDQMSLSKRHNSTDKEIGKDYFSPQPESTATTKQHLIFATPNRATKPSAITPLVQTQLRRHERVPSTNTILYNPRIDEHTVASSSSPTSRNITTARNSAKNSALGIGSGSPIQSASAGKRTPRRVPRGAAQPRPIMPPHSAFKSVPNMTSMMMLNNRDTDRRDPLMMDIGSDIGDNKAVGGGFIGAVPASFATQMAYATGNMRAGQVAEIENEDSRRISRIMLARMNNLEEGFREVLKEVKDWRKDDSAARSTEDERRPGSARRPAGLRRAKTDRKGKGKSSRVYEGHSAGEMESVWIDEDLKGVGDEAEPGMGMGSGDKGSSI